MANEYDELVGALDEDRQPQAGQSPFVPAPPPNEYVGLIDKTKKAEQSVLDESLRAASTTTPDARAEALKLAKQYNMPPDVIERNRDYYKAQAMQDASGYAGLLERAPKLAKWLATQPVKAAAATDDVALLAEQERTVSFGASILKGIDQVQGMWGRAIEWSGTVTGAKGLQAYGKDVAEWNEAQGAALGYKTEFKDIKDPSSLGQWLKETIGEQMPIMGTMAAGGATGAAIGSFVPVIGTTIGGLIGAFVPGLVLGVGETQGNIKQLDPTADAPFAAFIGGSAIAALDSVIPGRVGGRLVSMFGKEAAEDVAKRALLSAVKPQFVRMAAKEGLHGFATEGLTEAVQEAIGAVAAAQGVDQPLNTHAMWNAMIEAGAAGAVVGGSTNVTTLTATYQAERAKFAASQQQKLFFDALAAGATNSQLAKRLPEAYQEVIGEMTKGGPIEHVFVGTEAFTTYWQKKDINPAIVASELTGNPNALAEAADSGGMLQIPTAAYAAKLAGTEHHGFFSNELSLRPDAPNARESKAMEADVKQLADQVQQAVEAAAAGTEAPEVSASPLREAIATQVMNDPGFHAMVTRSQVDAVIVANVYAAGVEQVITNLSTRAGQDPLDVLSGYNLSIGPQGTQAAIDTVMAARQQPAGEATQDAARGLGTPGERSAAGRQDEGQAPPPAAAGEPQDATTLHQGPRPRKESAPALAVAPAVVASGRLLVSTRVPKAKGAKAADGRLRTDATVVLEDQALAAKVAAKIGATKLVSTEQATGAPEEVLEAAITRAMNNLRWLWHQYPQAWQERAKRWYVGANRIAHRLAEEHNVSVEQAAAVLAVLSPQMDWFKNVSLAERLMAIYTSAERDNPVFTAEHAAHYISRAVDAMETTATTIGNKYGENGAAKYRDNKMAALSRQREELEGRQWHDLPLESQARFLRVIDEMTNPRSYAVILPEGESAGLKMNADGTEAQVGWGTYGFIANGIRVMRDGSVETIHEVLGGEHKVRSFFNNISDPWDPHSVTIDTHAVAAAHLQPFSGTNAEVVATMGGISHAATGISGNNAIYAEAYFRLADELGVLPREVQSVTWEAVRGLFTPDQKKAGNQLGDTIARLLDKNLQKGTLTEEALRDEILKAAGGIRRPDWADAQPGLAYDEERLRRGDVLPAGSDLAARRRGAGSSAAGSPRRATQLADGPVVPRPAVLEAGRGVDVGVRTTSATRALDRLREAGTRPFEGRSARRAGKDGKLADGKHTANVFVPNGTFADLFAAAGFGAPTVLELQTTDDAADFFHAAITAAKGKIAEGAQVYVYDVADYRSMRLFVTPDHNAGFAIKGDGDIVSVFNHNTGGPRIANAMLALAVQQGGTKLDCFDTSLPHVYAINGFRVDKRDPWNEEYKPDGWDKAKFSRFKNGEPDVVYMVYDPVALKTGPITLYQDPRPAPTSEQWAYSRLQRAVDAAKQEKASGRDWKNIIKGSKLGVNQDEFLLADVSQLEDKRSYSKQEVLEFLRTHQAAVNWVVLANDAPNPSALHVRTEEVFNKLVADQIVEWEKAGRVFDIGGEPLDADQRADGKWEVGGAVYDTEEGANFALDVLHFEREGALEQEKRDQAEQVVDYEGAKTIAYEQLQEEAKEAGTVSQFREYTIDSGRTAESDSYREVFLTADVRTGYGFPGLTPDENAMFNVPEKEPMGRVRGDVDRLYLNKALFGPKERDTYFLNQIANQRRLADAYAHDDGGRVRAEIMKRVAVLEKLHQLGAPRWVSNTWRDGHDQYKNIENPIVRLRFNVREVAGVVVGDTVTKKMRVLFLEELQAPLETGQGDSKDARTFEGMPALFQKNWRELGLKWALRQAAEQGLDGLAWTNGAVQADRYSLAKVVEEISWAPSDNAGRGRDVDLTLTNKSVLELQVDTVDGAILSGGNTDSERFVGMKLAALVGDVNARTILGGEPSGKMDAGSIVVGGEGLKRLYDVDLVNIANKLPSVKQAGAKATTAMLKASEHDVGPQHVLPLTPALKSAVLGGQTLFQEDKHEATGEERGGITFSPSGINIEFLKNADLSTFLHETGHLYLHVMGDLVEKIRRGDAATWSAGQKTLTDDYAKVLKFLGVSSRDEIGREQHEKFARAFEAYLMRGQSPARELASAFGRYRSWLTKLYKSMITLNVDLTDEVVEVFDRLVASDEAIESARIEAKIEVFSTPEQVGMNAIEWQGYQQIAQRAHANAQNALATRILDELRRERLTWWKERKKEVATQIEAELRLTPQYRALLFLQKGEVPVGMDPTEPAKLSKQSIVEQFGKERLATLPKPYVYTTGDGLTPDNAAALFGFTSGDALLTALANTPPLQKTVADRTNQQMQAEYGNMRIDGTLKVAARAEVLENGYQDVLTAELKAIARAARMAKPIVTAAKAQVEAEEASARRAMRDAITVAAVPTATLDAIATERIGKVAPKDIKPQLYWISARAAGAAASKAFAAGKYEEAVAEKKKQRLAIAMHRAAVRAVEETDTIAKYAKRLGETPAQARLGRAGESYQAQVNNLLNKYEFQAVSNKALERRASLQDWMEDRQREGLPVDLPAAVLEAAQKQNFRTVPMAMLRDVRDSLKQIEHLARLKNSLMSKHNQQNYELQRDNLEQSLVTNNAALPAVLEFKHADVRRHRVANWFASHTRIATLAYQLDGHQDGGLMWQLLVRPLNDAANAETVRRGEEATKFEAVLSKHYPGKQLSRLQQLVEIKAINASLSREAILAVALNWGNETSRERLLSDTKRAWSRHQIEAILDTMDARDWSFVQETWDYVDTFWTEISDKTFRITGVRPEKVEAVHVDTKHGRFRGGYYPLQYDRRLAQSPGADNIASEAKLNMAAAYIRQTTRRGHLKTRLEHVDRPVKLELGVLFQHIDQVVHDLTHHEALIDVSRLLRDKKIADAIHRAGGDPVYKQFTDALTDIAVGKRPGESDLDKAMAWVKTGTQISALGLNLWTAMQQPLGLFNGAAEVGPTWMARGMSRLFRDASTRENTVAWIHEVSPFMRNRSTTATQDINDVHARLSEPGGWFDAMVRDVTGGRVNQSVMASAFLWHIGLAQKIADVPTWLGAYEKAKATVKNISDEDAVAMADQAVRNAQGGGQTVDLAAVQRLGPVARLFMVFYSYGNTVFNATAKTYGRTQFRSPKSLARFLGDLSMIYFFPALGTVVLSRLFGMKGDDDDDPAKWVAAIGAEMGGSALNTMVLARELGGLLRTSGRGYQGPAGTRLIQQMYDVANQAWQGEADEGLWKALNATGGIIFRYPAGQVQRSVEGLVALSEGQTSNPAAVLFGPNKDNR